MSRSPSSPCRMGRSGSWSKRSTSTINRGRWSPSPQECGDRAHRYARGDLHVERITFFDNNIESIQKCVDRLDGESSSNTSTLR